MAFTYDLATSRGQLRLAISDTNPGGYGFEDAELDYFLSQGGSHQAAVVLALRVLLVDSARRTKSFSVPGLSYNDSARIAAIKDALKLYGGDLPNLTVVSPGALPMDAGYTEQAILTVT